MERSERPPSGPTQYGFNFGPMSVERVAHDDRIGWVVTVKSHERGGPAVIVRSSPQGQSWTVEVRGPDVTSDGRRARIRMRR